MINYLGLLILLAFLPGYVFKSAILVTIAGQNKLSDYFEWSCRTIDASSSLFDMLVIHEGNKVLLNDVHCAANVVFINLGAKGFSNLIVNKLMELSPLNDTKQNLVSLLDTVITHIPRYLVEIKPVSGYLFEEYLSSYSHWTYSDPDIIWGDLPNFIEEEDLSNYDILTLSKSLDASRLFLRGQFSLHKNNVMMNSLWKRLSYFEPLQFAKRISDAANLITSEAFKTSSEYIFTKYFFSAEGKPRS